MDRKIITFSLCGLILFGAVMRLVPHLPNFTPISAIALAASWYFEKKWGLIVPLIAVLFSDLLIGFYTWQIMLSVYISFALVGVIGVFASKHRSIFSLSLASISSSVLFFLITNTAVWFYSPWYEKTFSGLMYSYELGLPFFRNMLIGDITYCAIVFSAAEAVLLMSQYKHSKVALQN